MALNPQGQVPMRKDVSKRLKNFYPDVIFPGSRIILPGPRFFRWTASIPRRHSDT